MIGQNRLLNELASRADSSSATQMNPIWPSASANDAMTTVASPAAIANTRRTISAITT